MPLFPTWIQQYPLRSCWPTAPSKIILCQPCLTAIEQINAEFQLGFDLLTVSDTSKATWCTWGYFLANYLSRICFCHCKLHMLQQYIKEPAVPEIRQASMLQITSRSSDQTWTQTWLLGFMKISSTLESSSTKMWHVVRRYRQAPFSRHPMCIWIHIPA